jgi:two-component system NtrC family sensor kinase
MSANRPDPINKRAMLGDLALGLVHEMNTPLAALCSNNDILDDVIRAIAEQRGAAADDFMAIAEDALRTNRLACERLQNLLRSVRKFARLDDAERRIIDLHEIIDTALTLLGHELKGRVQVTRDYGEIPSIEGNPSQLHQVFINILANAAQAIDGEGTIGIKTSQDEGVIRAALSDTGRGMTPEVQEHIFDAGFTTKGEKGGMGIGLSMGQKIIEEHRGRIEVESTVGAGATFTIVLPITQDPEGNAK